MWIVTLLYVISSLNTNLHSISLKKKFGYLQSSSRTHHGAYADPPKSSCFVHREDGTDSEVYALSHFLFICEVSGGGFNLTLQAPFLRCLILSTWLVSIYDSTIVLFRYVVLFQDFLLLVPNLFRSGSLTKLALRGKGQRDLTKMLSMLKSREPKLLCNM